MVFSKILNGGDFESQGSILEDVAVLVVAGRVRAIANLTAETMEAAHELVETARTIGKIVIAT
jgi:NADPH2:quinone reductase